VKGLCGSGTLPGLAGRLLLALLLCQTVPGSRAFAAAPPVLTLKPEAARAFQTYMQLTDERNQTELGRGAPLLWIDELPSPERTAAYDALGRGEIRLRKTETRENGRPIACPGGMIHHWEGVVFIPSARLDDVLAILKDYNQHSTYYAPDVERSQTESRDAEHFRVFLRFRRHKVITVVLNTEHEVQYFRDSAQRAHSRSSAVRISEVEDAGKSDEREKTPGTDNGFMWRMETWWRMEERDGGVYVQSEVVSLTRDIPTGLGWMIGPFVNSIPQESLAFTLEATRKAVVARTRK